MTLCLAFGYPRGSSFKKPKLPAYFKPLRRKIGMATLVLACLFLVGWVRSVTMSEVIAFPTGTRNVLCLLSTDGRFAFFFGVLLGRTGKLYVPVWDQLSATVLETAASSPETWSVSWGGLMIISQKSGGIFYVAPYSLVVIPLTLLAAWLLLSRPRVLTTPENQS